VWYFCNLPSSDTTMEKTSDHWTSFKDLDRESEHARKIDKVLNTANFVYLRSVALQARYDEDLKSNVIITSQSQRLTCTIDESQFTVGHNNIVFEIAFSDASQWIARVRLPDDKSNERDLVETSIMSEIATITLIASRTSIPVPKIHSFEVDATNTFGFRYLLMQALPGHHLDTGLSRSIPREYWDKVADQLSDYWHQLSCLRFDRIGRLWCGRNIDQREPTLISIEGVGGPFLTSLEYFYALRRSHNQHIEAAYASDKEWETSSWILEQSLPSMIIDNYIHGPFPICHMDFHYNNILIDDDFNITGIIDWSDAQTVPLERFTITPEFATFPGLSAEENESSVTFRKKFAAALKKREITTMTGGFKAPGGLPSSSSSSRFTSDLIGTPLWEIVYRSTYSYWWRARSDARLVLKQIYGANAKWDDFVSYYENGPIHQRKLLTVGLSKEGESYGDSSIEDSHPQRS